MKVNAHRSFQNSPILWSICEYHFGVISPAKAEFSSNTLRLKTKVTPFSGIPIFTELTSNKTKC
jgi:hypothetical protein